MLHFCPFSCFFFHHTTFLSSVLPSVGVKCKAETGAEHSVCASSQGPQGQDSFRAEDKPGVCESG